ncbi:MAG TPA: hypothetical protein VIU29_09795, partial [Candidatus Deferrimicrobiaceae bacterium]
AERLSRAVPVKASLSWNPDEARLTVTLKNETVGHKTPSGLPMHKIRLVSTILDARGSVLDRKEELFERVIGDGAGHPLEKPEQVFLEGREVLKDNRIGPKESRVIVHRFPLKGAKPASASVRLTYLRPVLDLANGPSAVEMPISQISVTAKAESMTIRYLIGALIAIALIAAVIALKKRD